MTPATAADLWKSGDLAGAIAAQTAVVKAAPADVEARSLLFALLSFAGEWERASSHLRVMAASDDQYGPTVAFLRGLLTAEVHRQGVVEGEADPVLPPDAPPHAEARLAVVKAWRDGDAAAAATALDTALAAQPDLAGTVNGEEFAGWRDLDDVLGSVLEVFAGGSYLWLPWERIRSLKVLEPQGMLDLLWAPAQILDVDDAELNVHLPAMYAGSWGWDDPELQLGRRTDWSEEAGLQRGQGQRVLARADAAGEIHDLSLLELRSLTFSS